MIFTMDIGNTNIKTGLFQGKELVRYWRLSTNRSSTSDEYGMLVTNLFRSAGLSPDQVTGIMLSSVVPPVNFTIEHMCNDYFGIVPKFVVPGVKTGINIQYDNPRALGSDRICNAVAVQAFYGAPCIFIDFGTATPSAWWMKRARLWAAASAPASSWPARRWCAAPPSCPISSWSSPTA